MWGRAAALHERCAKRYRIAPSDRPRTHLPQGPRPPAGADKALTAHELIKVRVTAADRTARRALFEEICARTGAEPVQQVGKVLVLWRPCPLDAA